MDEPPDGTIVQTTARDVYRRYHGAWRLLFPSDLPSTWDKLQDPVVLAPSPAPPGSSEDPAVPALPSLPGTSEDKAILGWVTARWPHLGPKDLLDAARQLGGYLLPDLPKELGDEVDQPLDSPSSAGPTSGPWGEGDEPPVGALVVDKDMDPWVRAPDGGWYELGKSYDGPTTWEDLVKDYGPVAVYRHVRTVTSTKGLGPEGHPLTEEPPEPVVCPPAPRYLDQEPPDGPGPLSKEQSDVVLRLVAAARQVLATGVGLALEVALEEAADEAERLLRRPLSQE